MNLNYLSSVITTVGIIFLFGHVVESSCLFKSPSTNDLNGLLSMLFGFEANQPEMKYDKKNHEWVEECPEIDCQYGKDEGDSETCPFCWLGPGESCGDWKGKCGEKLECQYQSTYSSSGKCVSEEEFNSRTIGDSCGCWEGECKDGLKCLVEPDPLTYFCGIKESGVCVTEEDFLSREEGETCGDSAGKCKEGLKCVQSDYSWFTSECQNLTKTENEPKHHEHLISIEEVIHNPEDQDGEQDQHISIALITDDDDSSEEKLIQEILESKLLGSFLGLKSEETEMIEEITHSAISKANTTEEEEKSQKITTTMEIPEIETTKSVVLEMDKNNLEFSPTALESQSPPEAEKSTTTLQRKAEII